MSFSLRTVLAALAVVLVSGCAGTDFRRPDPQAVVVGRSTAEDVTRVMGPPRQVGEAMLNGQKVNTMTYVYAAAAGEPLYQGVVPARALVFTTFGGVLVGQEFVSSFKQDATEFEHTKMSGIVKGRTTRSEVLALLGRPNGEAVYPMVKEKDQKGLVYSYAQAKGTVFNMKFHNKALVVSITPSDVVSDVSFVSNGEK
jgi:hypothetical protein